MDENLVGYLLDALDEKTQREVEADLQADPEARQRLARLRQALQPLACDKELPAPPSGLVVRTLTRVAEHICSQQELPHAPTLKFEAPAAPRRWWRRMDALIAACLLVTLLGLLLPALLRGRTNAAIIACQNNLQQFYVALQTYHTQHGGYPDIEREAPRNVAGMVVPILADAGALTTSTPTMCPGTGPHVACRLVTLAELRELSPEQFHEVAPRLLVSYGYSLGYRDADGYHSPGLNPLPSDKTPLLADGAPAEDGQGNSANHGGLGQNVLYVAGNVRWCVSRTVAGDDLYLNEQQRVAAGLSPADAVLGASGARP